MLERSGKKKAHSFYLKGEVFMKETVAKLIDEKISSLGMYVDDAFISQDGSVKNFNIVLDSEEVIDLNRIVEASNIINPIMDEANLVEGEYVLDIYSKEKGE